MEEQNQDGNLKTAERVMQSEAVNPPPPSATPPQEGTANERNEVDEVGAKEPAETVEEPAVGSIGQGEKKFPQTIETSPDAPPHAPEAIASVRDFASQGGDNDGVVQAVSPPPDLPPAKGETVSGEQVRVVEKIVEKPVEKIVEKIIEKPIEVIREVKVFDEARVRAEEKSRLIGSRAQALLARQRKRDEKLNKIIQFVREHGKVTNDEVQVLIGVTDRSAQRYLSLLARQGKLKKIGTRGKGLYYTI